jgi:hypothetical protein
MNRIGVIARTAPRIWLALLAALAVTGCTSGSTGSPSSSPLACEPAPPALMAYLEKGLSVRGATLSHGVIVRAAGLDPEPAHLPAAFGSAWWVGARITGAGVRPELIVWLVASLAPRSADQVMAANPAARRDSPWSPPDGEDLTGPGLSAVVDCVGPMPGA